MRTASRLGNSVAGARVTLEGRVRNIIGGRELVHLGYEAYEAVAVKESDKVIGVSVGVLASHSDAAFRACRYISDEMKLREPIRRKELLRDCDAEWMENDRLRRHKASFFSRSLT